MANKDKLLESAQKFLAKGQIPKAIGEYEKLIQAFPKDYRNRQKLAELLGREKRNAEAQPHYEAVAKNFAEMGFYLKAIAIYKQMQKVEPNRVDLYLRLAELNEKQGLIGNALNEYRSLLAFYDKNRMGRETVGVLQKVIALDPENLGFRAKLIETHLAIGDEAESLAQLRTLVKFLAGKGEQAKVVKLYEKFLNLCPEDVEHRLPLAEALVASGQHEKALSLLKSLLKQTPDHPALLTALTDCHMAVGNHADARLTCQHLLKDHQNDLALRERYVRICMAEGDFARALESLEESKEFFSQGNRVDVLKGLYETLQVSLPDNDRLQATLAAIYETTGDTGMHPTLATAGQAVAVEEETADAAVLDAAIDDVEHLDLVGGTTPPTTVVPPLGAPATSTAPSKAKGGLELELDLDLDLDLSPTAQPPAASAPIAAPAPVVAEPPPASTPIPAAPESTSSLELDLDLGGLEGMEDEPSTIAGLTVPEASAPDSSLEMELDLGGLEAVEVEPVVVVEEALPEEAVPTSSLEMELDLAGLETVEAEPLPAEPVTSEEQPAQEEVGSTPSPELNLEGLAVVENLGGDLSFEVELPSEEETAVEAPSADEPEALESFVEVEVASIEEPEVLDELEEVEEVEELEEDELDELEELVEDVEPVEDEGVEEVESLEEIEELDDLEEVSEEVEAVPMEAVSISPQQLRNDLEEAEFYLRQGLFDDAERVVGELRQRHGDLSELIEKLAEIDAQRQSAAESEGKVAVFDLMDDIRDGELLGATDFLEETPSGAADGFSEALPTEDNEDAQSHFDLGIAYKEMGLLDDAIAEFSKAAKDPSRRLDCLILKGQCQVEMSGFDKAEESFKEALDQLNVTEEVRVALQYELGLLYEATGRLPEALEKFQIVADLDLFFRDVTDKLKSLRTTLGLDDDIEDAIAPRSNRDRISFV